MYKAGLTKRGIALRLSISKNTVKKYLSLFEETGHSWEVLLELDDKSLKALTAPSLPPPDKDRYVKLENRFEYMEKELRRVGVTKWLLWQEYKQEEPGGYGYSRFCHHFFQWLAGSGATMHFDHKAGDKLFVDFAGKKLWYIDGSSGEPNEAEVFVATLGASQLCIVIAVESQKKEFFISCLTQTVEYLGGVPAAVVPDNLKSAVTKANNYEPDLNPTLAEWARYYGTTILAARPAKPRDKSLVEGSVRLVYQQIYAPLRNQTFQGLEELNKAIRSKLKDFNNRLFHRREYSRRDLFTEIELPELAPLPLHPFQMRKHIKPKVGKNCHVWLGEDKHHYSVPYRYIGKKADLYYSANTVEIYIDYERVAFHKRKRNPYGYTTCKDHMPSSHQFVSDWSPEMFTKWAHGIGPHTEELIIGLLNRKDYPEQAYRSCLGILGMAGKKDIGKRRLELACKRAVSFGHYNYKLVERILRNRLENVDEQDPDDDHQLPEHENIRGEEYYNQNQ